MKYLPRILLTTIVLSIATTSVAQPPAAEKPAAEKPDVDALAEQRGLGEIIVGWVHSHPFSLCDECPQQAPSECIDKILFFSRDDQFVMQQMFHQPFMIGLLTAIEPRIEAGLGRLPVRLFGWRHGRLVKRGFSVHDLPGNASH